MCVRVCFTFKSMSDLMSEHSLDYRPLHPHTHCSPEHNTFAGNLHIFRPAKELGNCSVFSVETELKGGAHTGTSRGTAAYSPLFRY